MSVEVAPPYRRAPSDPPAGRASDAAPASASRSPALEHFRTNAFRVLRIAAATPAQEAVWAAEKAVTLMRAGMARPKDDALPWLAAPDELEIQEAAQRVEEPLRRLRDQLLWFDFETDANGAMFQSALKALDPSLVASTLGLAPVPRPTGQGAAAIAAPSALSPAEFEDLAGAVNLANFRLLVAAAALHERFAPAGAGHDDDRARTSRPILGTFETVGGLKVLAGAHASFAPGSAAKRSDVSRFTLLRDALAAWGALLESPKFAGYIAACIEKLGDELVTAADVETLTEALRTALADLLGGEARAFLLAGRADRASEVATAAFTSGLDGRVWVTAFKPLRHVFRTEIDDLASLLEGTPDGGAIGVYLARLKLTAERFRALDKNGVLGLEQLVDDAVSQAFGRIAAFEAAIPDAEIAARSGEVRELAAAATELTRSESLRQKLLAYVGRLDNATKYLCHFCRARPGGPNAILLSGTKETGREMVGYNRWRVYYETRRALIDRCDACADWQQWVRSRGTYVGYVAAACALAYAALSGWGVLQFGAPPAAIDAHVGVGLIAATSAALGLAISARAPKALAGVCAALAFVVFFLMDDSRGLSGFASDGVPRTALLTLTGLVLGIGLGRIGLSLLLKPKGVKHHWSIEDSEAYQTLSRGGYGGALGNVRRDFTKGALERLKAGVR